jgi:hypothetical protein
MFPPPTFLVAHHSLPNNLRPNVVSSTPAGYLFGHYGPGRLKIHRRRHKLLRLTARHYSPTAAAPPSSSCFALAVVLASRFSYSITRGV